MFHQVLAKSSARRVTARRVSARRVGEALYAAAAAQARREDLYAVMGAPDTVEGRFELLTLHVILLIDRLKDASCEGSGPGEMALSGAVRQALFDAYVSNLDGALREMGVGDLVVGKRMRKLGEAFYGRAQAYDEAFAALPRDTSLRGLIARTALRDDAADAGPLCAYVRLCRQSLAEGDTAALISGAPAWPAR